MMDGWNGTARVPGLDPWLASCLLASLLASFADGERGTENRPIRWTVGLIFLVLFWHACRSTLALARVFCFLRPRALSHVQFGNPPFFSVLFVIWR